jgi:hypothetical protein
MKLLAEMPKIAKCLKCLKPFGQEALDRLRYSVNFNKLKRKVGYYFPGFSYAKHQSFIIKTERSDSTILGILAHFRHFPVYPG